MLREFSMLAGVVLNAAILIVAGVIVAGVTSPAFGQATSATQSATAAKPVTHIVTKPTAIIKTTVGNLTCALFPDKAPLGVQNFIGLASGTKDWKSPTTGATKHGVPLYDGTIFHRVIPEFMIQGGDPAGNGAGNPGFQFKNEVSDDLTFDRPGRLAYANAGRDTNGSQFFITEVPVPRLNGGYTIFGQCDDAAVELVKQIARMAVDPATDHMPLRPVKILHISIVRSTASGAKPGAGTTAKKPAAAKPAAPANPN
jgi:peptidyl-prolyl cis-trans isomerase A (cyclophilin A)